MLRICGWRVQFWAGVRSSPASGITLSGHSRSSGVASRRQSWNGAAAGAVGIGSRPRSVPSLRCDSSAVVRGVAARRRCSHSRIWRAGQGSRWWSQQRGGGEDAAVRMTRPGIDQLGAHRSTPRHPSCASSCAPGSPRGAGQPWGGSRPSPAGRTVVKTTLGKLDNPMQSLHYVESALCLEARQ